MTLNTCLKTSLTIPSPSPDSTFPLGSFKVIFRLYRRIFFCKKRSRISLFKFILWTTTSIETNTSSSKFWSKTKQKKKMKKVIWREKPRRGDTFANQSISITYFWLIYVDLFRQKNNLKMSIFIQLLLTENFTSIRKEVKRF